MVDEVGSNDAKKSTPKFSEILRRPRGDTEVKAILILINVVYVQHSTCYMNHVTQYIV